MEVVQYADVIVDVSLEQLDKTFQYRIPSAMEEEIYIGAPVKVPFGRGDRLLDGFVMDISTTPKFDPEKTKEIRCISTEAIGVEGDMIRLAGWMKQHYGATMNQALRTVLPVKKKAPPKKRRMVFFLLNEEEANSELSAMLRRSNHSVAKERLLRILMEQNELPWEMITGKLDIDSVHIRDFEKKGFLRVETYEDFRTPHMPEVKDEEKIILNPVQQDIVNTFCRDYEAGLRKTYLLYGVTGSGKTQVYIEMMDRVIREGRQVIFLIPEIALTYQTLMRLYRRFGDGVSVINSRMSPSERFDQFERARRGEISVMVGPRSALFTPFPNLGLIVMDEEHEGTYKSEQLPKYHARETAVYRASIQDAAVVLGSATPSLESFNRALDGEYELFTMTERVEEHPLPSCEVVDLRRELSSGNRSPLSRRLQELLSHRLEKHEQSMLFLNRRGLMGFVSCRACGHVIKCPHCDISLSLHRDGKLHCHYCGYTTANVKTCPECGSKFIGTMKAGTEKIQELLEKMYPSARILRMDADTTAGKDGHEKILSAFANREADILVGTQMIVKGHDFSGVTLVGVLAADMSLNADDYRSGERTFQLLTQAAGRAGRGDLPGQVVIQTYQPEHYAITTAAAQDYEAFYKEEMAYRKLMNYPPAGHLLLVTLTGTSYERLTKDAKAVFFRLTALDRKDVILLGPKDASVLKIKDVYRMGIYVKSPSYDALISIKDLLEEDIIEKGLYKNSTVWFDFDPMRGM